MRFLNQQSATAKGGHPSIRRFTNSLTLFLALNSSANVAAGCSAERQDSIPTAVSQFNYRIGTQQVGTSLTMGKQPTALAAALEMRRMGATICKLALSSNYVRQLGVPENKMIRSVKTLVMNDPSLSRILKMPFSNYVFWVYPFASDGAGGEFTGIPRSAPALQKEYEEIYELTSYLLETFRGTGKTFCLGNWEGDWHLFPGRDPRIPPDPERIRAMAAWFNIRQQAVDDARRASRAAGVQVYFYIEVNQGVLAMEGKPCVVNSIFPLLKKSPDLLSISAYSIQNLDATRIAEILDYHAARLDTRTDIKGKRIFIGEYGYARQPRLTEEERGDQYRRTALKFMQWGARFIVSWQLFNNTFKRSGRNLDYSLIDSTGLRSPALLWQEAFFKQARPWVAAYYRIHHQPPDDSTYQKKAIAILKELN